MSAAVLVVACLWPAVAGPQSARDALSPPGSTQSPLVYAGDARFAPYEYLAENGDPAGFNVELIRLLAQRMGTTVTIRLTPWAQVRPALEDGRADVAAMYRSSLRAREVDFAVPHELVYHEMYVRSGSPPLLSIEGLAGKRVAVQAATRSADALPELGLGLSLTTVASEPDALQQVLAGRADVAIVSQAVGRPFVERERLAARLVATGPPVFLSEYAFVVRKGRGALIERLNDAMMDVKASGEYERLYAKWIRGDSSSARLRIAGSVLAATALGLVVIVGWNHTLRRQVRLQTASLTREYAEKEAALVALAQTEHSLHRAQKMEVLGRLAGGVAHDFNNLLTVILSFSQFVRDQALARDCETADIDEVLAASERAVRLTRQLLAFSRSTPIEPVPIDLGALAVENTVMIRRLVGAQILVEVQVPDVPVVIKAEPTQVEQILLNLAANARDAMPHGGRLVVEVGQESLTDENSHGLAPGDVAVLRVTDTGVGIDAETQSRLFEPFFTTKARGAGTGLGLATVMAHVTRLQGGIVVESVPGHGATFCLRFPLADAPMAGPVLERDPVTDESDPQRILLVEDDEPLRRAARLTLVRAGHQVTEAHDGEEALTLVRDGLDFSVLVTDVVMPRLSGPRLVAELRRLRTPLRVLFLSGYVSDEDRLDLSVPGTAFLRKPYTPSALVNAVHAVVQRHGESAVRSRSGCPEPSHRLPAE